IEKINRARVGDRFHLAGFLGQKDLEKLLQMSTVVVMPSASEPFGLVAIEAAQTGTPVVISTHSGAREVLPHALTAAPGNVEDFAEKVGALLSYPALRTEISQGLQEDVSKLSWEASALDLVKRWREASLHP
ncbi:MAG: glycosyltransferase family 4 protein, partial [Bacteroidota bacterium]